MFVRKYAIQDNDFFPEIMAVRRKNGASVIADDGRRPGDLATVPFEQTAPYLRRRRLLPRELQRVENDAFGEIGIEHTELDPPCGKGSGGRARSTANLSRYPDFGFFQVYTAVTA